MYYCLEYIPTHGFAYMDFFFSYNFWLLSKSKDGEQKKSLPTAVATPQEDPGK